MGTQPKKTRLLLNNNLPDLDKFKAYIQAILPLQEYFDVRVAISHHHKLKFHERFDTSDPYLFYSLGFTAFSDFVIPNALAHVLSADFVRNNVLLMQEKHAILEKVGLKAAFVGHEPVYFPEPLFTTFPHWRGPRIDHPRRSKNPCFALCMHEPEVQALYTEMA